MKGPTVALNCCSKRRYRTKLSLNMSLTSFAQCASLIKVPPNRTDDAIPSELRVRLKPVGSPRMRLVEEVLFPSLRAHIGNFWERCRHKMRTPAAMAPFQNFTGNAA